MTLQHRNAQLETYIFYYIVPQMVHPNVGVIVIIIRELHRRQMVVPTNSKVYHTRPQHVLQGLNGALCLPISLRMKGSIKLYLRS